jgi:hypothetical protein
VMPDGRRREPKFHYVKAQASALAAVRRFDV